MVEPGSGDEATAAGAAPDPLALVRQATGSDAGTGLEAIRQLRPLLDEWERQQVERARAAGWNWAEIAKRLGRHRQAVHREYATRRPKG
ncbi:MAG TPA: helix-turn-helix domain-containing protein [Acidimicrobiales bacterium]|nr:helix-turn-helix domain-containing protein [Acidimicrobiales bacterium]